MREADAQDLAINPLAVEALVREQQLWGDPGDPVFDLVRNSIAAGEAGAVTVENARQFFHAGKQSFRDPRFPGAYEAVIVLFKVDDAGFGQLPYRSKCLVQDGKVATWIDPVPVWTDG